MTTEERNQLESTARRMVVPGRGLLAADESNGTMTKRLEELGIESTEESRRVFRELLFTADGTAEHISGVIMYDETIRQSTADGTPFPEYLEAHDMLPGIKVDTGAKPLAGSPDEKVTEGLDGLRERLEEYRDMGATFAKWRAALSIAEGLPSQYCIDVNAHALARYAALCQEAGIVPIVEPEVLMDGDHSLDRSDEVTAATLHAVFDALFEQRVMFEGMVLKPNMVLSGYEASDRASAQEVAERTIACLRRVVPPAVPGITFLSGGQTDEEASANLNAMNAIGGQPWQLSFSYGRALQGTPMKTWVGEESNAEEAQVNFLHRARCTSAARDGQWSEDMEHELVA